MNQDEIPELLKLNPLGQGISEDPWSLGLGWIYYSLVRTLRPSKVVAIGSLRGFSFMCLAIGLRDNNLGRLYSIDPGFEDDFWRDKRNVYNLGHGFAVKDRWTHFQCTSEQALRIEGDTLLPCEICLIDGDHSAEGLLFDLLHFGTFSEYILIHDAFNPEFQLDRTIQSFLSHYPNEYEALTIPVGATLTILRNRRHGKGLCGCGGVQRGGSYTPLSETLPEGGVSYPFARPR